jgi:hypothetical protein
VIAYRAVLDVPRELVRHLAGLLAAERRRRGHPEEDQGSDLLVSCSARARLVPQRRSRGWAPYGVCAVVSAAGAVAVSGVKDPRRAIAGRHGAPLWAEGGPRRLRPTGRHFTVTRTRSASGATSPPRRGRTPPRSPRFAPNVAIGLTRSVRQGSASIRKPLSWSGLALHRPWRRGRCGMSADDLLTVGPVMARLQVSNTPSTSSSVPAGCGRCGSVGAGGSPPPP